MRSQFMIELKSTDLTYPLNINLNFRNVSRTLSINSKRGNFNLKNLLTLAEEFTIKNPKGNIKDVQDITKSWASNTKNLEVPERVMSEVEKEFVELNDHSF